MQRGALVAELLAPLSLALVSAFIAFNKVGSPQYMTWLAVPIILGIATQSMGHGRSFPCPDSWCSSSPVSPRCSTRC